LAQAVPFDTPVPIAEGVSARWREAGHMLGSASIELTVQENGRQRIIVFSGDLGPTTLPVVREFETFTGADLVFLESTYGDRDHRPYSETLAEFEALVIHAARTKSKIIVPSFAIGRAQQILYHLAVMFQERTVESFHIFLDSPMAIQASKAMVNYPDLFDQELLDWKSRGLFPLDKSWFHATESPKESRRLNEVPGPCLILAGSGMCTGGRVLHHFRENLPRETTQVLIVGYQGKGSLGRKLVEGASSVPIYGERVAVRAAVHTLNGFSAHAGRSDLLKWFSPLAASNPRILITHGEERGRTALCAAIRQQFGLTPHLPAQGEVIEL
jgi:metallo-beta-lactamase family protein